jgi:hypothetical protein
MIVRMDPESLKMGLKMLSRGVWNGLELAVGYLASPVLGLELEVQVEEVVKLEPNRLYPLEI